MKSFIKKWASILVLFAILVGINVIISKTSFLNFSLDLTSEKLFSMSEGTKNIVKNMPGDITIKAFISDNLPKEFSETESIIKDLLTQISSVDDKITLEMINPTNGSDGEDEATKYGIQPVRFQVIKQDQFAYQEGYMGIAIIYGGNHETIASIQDISSLEYDMALAFKKLSNSKKPSVAIYTDPDMAPRYSGIVDILSRTYEPSVIKNIQDIDKFDGAILLGNLDSITERNVRAIKDYMAKDGVLMIFPDTGKVGNGLEYSPNESKIFDLLKDNNIIFSKELVMDRSNELASFSTGPGSQFITPYPFWVKVLPEGLNKNSNITRGLTTLNFPWTASIVSTDNLESLVNSSTVAWLSGENPNLYPDQKIVPDESKQSQYSLVAKVKDKKIVIGGTSRIFDIQFLNQFPNNSFLLLNIFDSLLLDDNLSLIRNKQINLIPLSPTSDYVKSLYKTIFIGIIPLLLAIQGMIYLMKRRLSSRIVK